MFHPPKNLLEHNFQLHILDEKWMIVDKFHTLDKKWMVTNNFHSLWMENQFE